VANKQQPKLMYLKEFFTKTRALLPNGNRISPLDCNQGGRNTRNLLIINVKIPLDAILQ
jgi:hypothetical protein